MTPKSLLRHPLALARPRDLAEGHFRLVLDDPRTAERPAQVRRVALCSGKIWTDVEAARSRAADEDRGAGTAVAVVRVEQLYPFPVEEVEGLLRQYARADEVVWLQEEPRNMGAWRFAEPILRDLLERVGSGQSLRYVGRPEMASPAEGWADVHAVEQRRIVEDVLSIGGAAVGRTGGTSHARKR